jgi:hypothetical protein
MNNNTHELLRHLTQRYTNPGRRVIRPTKFLAVASGICRSTVWNSLPVISLVPGILRWLLKFWKVCAPNAVSHNAWRKILLEKLTVTQLVKKFLPLCGIQSSLPCSQILTLNSILNHKHRLEAFTPYFHKILFPFMPRSCRCSVFFSDFPTASIAANWQNCTLN